jgi:hypothetical protein
MNIFTTLATATTITSISIIIIKGTMYVLSPFNDGEENTQAADHKTPPDIFAGI